MVQEGVDPKTTTIAETAAWLSVLEEQDGDDTPNPQTLP